MTAAIESSLRGRALRSATLAFVRYGGAQMLRLIGNLILTRLLFAEAFGLMTLVAVLLQALQMFSDLGIRPSIVRSARGDDPVFLDTAYTVQAVRGVGQWLIACACAVPFARLYGEPILVQMVPVLGFSAVITGLASTKQYTQDRDMQLGRLVVMELVSQACGTLLMVLLALAWHSVWALGIGAMFTTLVRTTLSFVLLPGRNNRLRWEPAARGELFAFGRWVFVSTVLTFASQSADRLLFGKLVTMEMLGVYSIGRMMAAAPTEALAQIGMSSVFPLFSRIVNAGQPLGAAFVRVRRPLLVLSGFGLAALAACGGALIDVLYDDRYRDAGWVVQTLAVGAWFTVIWNVNVAALLALGESKWMAATTAVKTATMIAAIPVGAALGGFHGAVAGIAVAEALTWVVSAVVVARHGLAGFGHDWPLTGLFGLSAALGYFAGHGLLDLPALPALAISGAVVSALWLPLAWPLLRMLRNREVLFAP
jgi:O-antigen/teichoic acid export membrane protein